MKVLSVSSGNKGDIGILVKNQNNSLVEQGIEIGHYSVIGKGIFGYLKNIPGIRKAYYNGKYDLVHAHYLLSAVATSLAGRFPLVVSLMGSDLLALGLNRLIAGLFTKFDGKRQ